MSGNVGTAISESGIVENVGLEPSHWTLSVELLFPLPVSTSDSYAEISGFRCRPMSGCVGRAISKSGTVENVGVAVGIASSSHFVQKLFPLQVPWPTCEVSDVGRCRDMSTVPYLGRAWSKK